MFSLLNPCFPGGSPGQPWPGERSPRSTKVGMAQPRLAGHVPPACPFPGPRGVNSGHSRHLSVCSRRSALVQVSTVIVARSSKLGLAGRPTQDPPTGRAPVG